MVRREIERDEPANDFPAVLTQWEGLQGQAVIWACNKCQKDNFWQKYAYLNHSSLQWHQAAAFSAMPAPWIPLADHRTSNMLWLKFHPLPRV